MSNHLKSDEMSKFEKLRKWDSATDAYHEAQENMSRDLGVKPLRALRWKDITIERGMRAFEEMKNARC